MGGLLSTAPDRVLRPACRLAVAVAVAGEQAEPPQPAPSALRPVLGFRRLSAAAYATIAAVIDDDGVFRARVAEAADEAEVGRAGWLWLHRPVGWADEVAALAAAGVDRDAEAGDAGTRAPKDRSAKHRRAAAEADAARRRARDEASAARRAEAEVRAERDALVARVEALQQERNAAVRRAQALEAELATARRDLRLAREATREAEHELLALRADPGGPSAAAADRVDAPAPESPASAVDDGAVAQAVRDASVAASALAASLGEAAAALGAAVPPVAVDPGLDVGAAHAEPEPRPRRRPPARTHPDLPPGVFDGTPEAHRHLIGSAANLLVVDGYNLARAAWSGLAPEEERRRTVALLEDVQARSGGPVVVVFDGDDAVSAPLASRSVRVRFSAGGQTADDAIAELVAATPAARPVVVVSSDRAVAADARDRGAVAIGSADLLRAAGR